MLVDQQWVLIRIHDDQTCRSAGIFIRFSMSLSKEKDFWAKAKNLQKELKAKIEGMTVHELLVMSEYFHGSVKKMVKYLRCKAGGHDLKLSNMGRLGIPENYDSFEMAAVAAIEFAGWLWF